MNLDRLFIIDNCLADRSRLWTLQDLIDQCGEVMCNSKRSVQGDLKLLRTRYGADIEVTKRKYYRYKDPTYRLADCALDNENKVSVMEAVQRLADYCQFHQMKNTLGEVIKLGDRIADRISADKLRPKSPKGTGRVMDIRLWIDSRLVPGLLSNPIHPSQRVEQYEIDGSANVIIHTVLTSKLRQWVADQNGLVIIQ